MKKYHILSLILICVITVSFAIFTKAVYDDEDSTFDLLCSANDFFHYEKLFAAVLSCTGVFYEQPAIAISPQSILAYLEQHEKESHHEKNNRYFGGVVCSRHDDVIALCRSCAA
jgi:hypothetical protein